jgi:hypothetical protein
MVLLVRVLCVAPLSHESLENTCSDCSGVRVSGGSVRSFRWTGARGGGGQTGFQDFIKAMAAGRLSA